MANSFPHGFNGFSGAETATRLQFPGAIDRCNSQSRQLYEFPVFKDGRKYDKTKFRGGSTPTPARVVYVSLDNVDVVLCGVMTHVVERAHESGSGDFVVCTKS